MTTEKIIILYFRGTFMIIIHVTLLLRVRCARDSMEIRTAAAAIFYSKNHLLHCSRVQLHYDNTRRVILSYFAVVDLKFI